ncbi:NAD-dependent histone deacetylase sir2 [Mortierella polycephala]|uniref:NAD-dependent histone deacetylase sir2 n=1 Tax=Mortierella polycephala TaxID=41804 RepID=A0A9P6U317_9FUNG|nr:NAD-dependent histone deacetylase sir2 [Mortierella polycephala]
MSHQRDSNIGHPRPQIPQHDAEEQDAIIDVVGTTQNLQVPANRSRPESPVNRKRADEDDGDGMSGRGSDINQDGSFGRNSLPPSKKSKTSPPLPPGLVTKTESDSTIINNIKSEHTAIVGSRTDYRASREAIVEDALSPEMSPILAPSMPAITAPIATVASSISAISGVSHLSTNPTALTSGEKRYSPVSSDPVQSKARKLDEDHHRPTSPPFRPISPPFRPASPVPQSTTSSCQAPPSPTKQTIPSFTRSATAILDSLSKPGENSLGNLSIGTSIHTRVHVKERAMGVITSRPGSRQTSPEPGETPPAGPTTTATMTTEILDIIADEAVETFDRSAVSRLEAMVTGSDDEHRQIGTGTLELETMLSVNQSDDSDEDDDGQDSNNGKGDAMSMDLPADGPRGFMSDIAEDDYDSMDSMDEIDVENIGTMDDYDSESEGSPYIDPDPDCLDRLTEEETDDILDEARMYGVGFVVRKYIQSGLISAKKMLLMTIPGKIELPDVFTENDLIRTVTERIRYVLKKRKRLQHIHSLEHVVNLLKTSKKIMVLTGAGVSVSCGIPDFRSEDGIYSRLSEFELDDPQQMFDLDFFRERPEIFYSFAREIFPSNFMPSPSHYFIRLLEEQGKLLRNYTQNIDTLEQMAGIKNVLQCHGSFATASCVRCANQVVGEDIKDSIFKQEVAYCKVCKTPSPPPLSKSKAKAKAKKKTKSGYSTSDEDESDEEDDANRALMKPDIVFFGEKLPAIFDQSLKEDRENVDLLIVIGSSLKVAPVSDIMHQLPNSVPQILINRTPNFQMAFDVQLLGNCDTIVAELCRMAGWELKHEKLLGGTSNVLNMDANTNSDGTGVGGRAAWSLIPPNIYLFEGADLEELDFEAMVEKNRKRNEENQQRAMQDNKVLEIVKVDEGIESDDDSDSDSDEEMMRQPSQRRPLSGDDRAGSTGLMDVEVDDQSSDSDSDEGQEIVKEKTTVTATASAAPLNTVDIASAAALTPASASAHAPALTVSVESVRVSSQSPCIRPVGFATGTTEPRSGSITEIHLDILSDAKRHAASLSASTSESASSASNAALLSPTLSAVDSSKPAPQQVSSSMGQQEQQETEDVDIDDAGHDVVVDEDDDEEAAKIRVMFTEKMPKDLGEEPVEGEDIKHDVTYRHVLSHSRRPSADLTSIPEDAQLEIEDDDNGDSNGTRTGAEAGVGERR